MNATGGLIKPGNSSEKTVLLNLPNELLLQVARRTGPDGEGINFNLRRVSKQMRAIANKQLPPMQRFRLENGPELHATAGYDAQPCANYQDLPQPNRVLY